MGCEGKRQTPLPRPVGAKWMSQPVSPSPAVGRPRETGIETPERSQQTPPDG